MLFDRIGVVFPTPIAGGAVCSLAARGRHFLRGQRRFRTPVALRPNGASGALWTPWRDHRRAAENGRTKGLVCKYPARPY